MGQLLRAGTNRLRDPRAACRFQKFHGHSGQNRRQVRDFFIQPQVEQEAGAGVFQLVDLIVRIFAFCLFVMNQGFHGIGEICTADNVVWRFHSITNVDAYSPAVFNVDAVNRCVQPQGSAKLFKETYHTLSHVIHAAGHVPNTVEQLDHGNDGVNRGALVG